MTIITRVKSIGQVACIFYNNRQFSVFITFCYTAVVFPEGPKNKKNPSGEGQ
jgi:hypothetical protein